jgi:hypothetical protein
MEIDLNLNHRPKKLLHQEAPKLEKKNMNYEEFNDEIWNQ